MAPVRRSIGLWTATAAPARSAGHRVFFGALDPRRLGVGPRLMRILPAGRRLLEQGDFRNWPEIASWADGIAGELAGTRSVAVAAG